jgi:hypothetical protein
VRTTCPVRADPIDRARRRLNRGVPGGWWNLPEPGIDATGSRSADGAWVDVVVRGENDCVRLEPFTDVEIDFADWWAGR